MLMGIRLLNSMGLAGLSYVGYDVGGFIGEPSKELFGRWVSIATFSPFMRGHTMVDTKDQEPWSFGERIEDLSRNYISLRYKLLPYLYSSFYEATQNGLPVQRSLAIDYTHDARIYENKYQHQYLFGKNLLVAPVESTKEITKVLLPKHEGGWYDFYTDKHYADNTEVLEEAPLDSLPVFVKAGAIVPMQSVVQNTTEKGDKTLYLHIYKGTQPTDFMYYEDDGESYNYEKGEFLKRKITYNPDKKEIVLEAVEGNFTSKFENIQFVLHQVADGAKLLTINGKNVATQTVTVEMMKPMLDFSVNPPPPTHKTTQNVGVKVANEKGRIVVKW
jgi:alpha-glucosidase